MPGEDDPHRRPEAATSRTDGSDRGETDRFSRGLFCELQESPQFFDPVQAPGASGKADSVRYDGQGKEDLCAGLWLWSLHTAEVLRSRSQEYLRVCSTWPEGPA